MRVYFAHPYRTIGTIDEEILLDEMEQQGWDVLNPFDHAPIDAVENIKSGVFSSEDAAALVNNDLAHILECDIILAWIPEGIPAVGTICEMMFAATQGKKYVIVVHERPTPHSWVVHYADDLYLSIEDFINDKEVYCDL